MSNIIEITDFEAPELDVYPNVPWRGFAECGGSQCGCFLAAWK